MKRKQKIISLGVLAKQLNTTKSKLEYYNILGLIKPVSQMTGGIRIFDEIITVRKIEKIKELQAKGIPLRKIKEELKNKK